ncbi:DUF4159 domain-containing protein [Haloferula sp. A504]|uniref:DUF4159 domain-containing protein n=1 Tax=Haloferula sp. A504 TaxID=3373601 RepID=UPI0031C8A0B2|nr:DUF4159 domain-containing protein [Verrucomicrobiaceae bacterium E54]
MNPRTYLSTNRKPLLGVAASGVWLLAWLDAWAFFVAPIWLLFGIFTTGLVVAGVAVVRARRLPKWKQRAVWSLSIFSVWQFLVYLTHILGADEWSRRFEWLGVFVVFFTGLAWVVWWVHGATRDERDGSGKRIWNPLNLSAWYYACRSPKLRQSLATILSYGFCFCLCFLVISQFRGCSIYESPAGGGEVAQLQQVVKIQKVERRKYVINPFSSVVFNPPPINEIKLQLLEVTEHLYKVGQGKGDGAGFSKGTKRGKVRFIRLKYDGGDWDQDMNRGSDLNLLTEYGVRTGHPVSDRPEPMEIMRLRSFPARKSPPLVYMTGQRGIQVSSAEIKVLRHYLTDQHGMLFGDNGGSPGWGSQFIDMMRRVLPRVEPISLYLDHPIHRAPYPLPKLPYVAKHGRSDALGWVVDGRLVAYYHPGDIGDAWADGHSGVPREIWESCYQLGVNVIFYAHVEYDRWLNATKEDEE